MSQLLRGCAEKAQGRPHRPEHDPSSPHGLPPRRRRGRGRQGSKNCRLSRAPTMRGRPKSLLRRGDPGRTGWRSRHGAPGRRARSSSENADGPRQNRRIEGYCSRKRGARSRSRDNPAGLRLRAGKAPPLRASVPVRHGSNARPKDCNRRRTVPRRLPPGSPIRGRARSSPYRSPTAPSEGFVPQ